MLNKVQKAASELIQSDARFIYTLVDIHYNAQTINSNYIAMSLPYIGIFADGAEQWCKKVGLNAPKFSAEEKEYYVNLRQAHKLFEMSYEDYETLLLDKFRESDDYFYNVRRLFEKVVGYYNVGTDLCNGEFCGNTIICALHTPIKTIGNEQVGNMIKGMSVIAGKLSAYLVCTENLPYKYNDCLNVTYKDFHFYKDCPLKLRTSLGFELFTILCIVNYVTVFIEKYFIEEIPQKFKFAYLQYYYLCDFIKEFSVANNIGIGLNSSLKNRGIRNCLAHYGLGQFLSEDDVIEDDVLKGLTYKAFGMDYNSTKEHLFEYLRELTEQIKYMIF